LTDCPVFDWHGSRIHHCAPQCTSGLSNERRKAREVPPDEAGVKQLLAELERAR
jgi:hypothetical protein